MVAGLVILCWLTFREAGQGTIRIELSEPPAQVEVRLDGKPLETMELAQPLTLRTGRHELVVAAPDFSTVTQSLSSVVGRTRCCADT